MDLVGVFCFALSRLFFAYCYPMPESPDDSLQGFTSFNQTDEDLNSKVISGYDAVDKQFPFMVYLINLETQMECSASIISETYVLTAAHCVVINHRVLHKSAIIGFAGSVDNEKRNSKLHFCRIFVHPGYIAPGINDIALLRTNEPIPFNAFVKPIPITPWDPFYPDDHLVSVIGWGRVNCNKPEFPKKSRILQFSPRIPVYINGATNSNNLLCYSFEKSGLCPGDSGGPWIIEKEEGPVVVGITSNGFGKEHGAFLVLHAACSEMISVHWNFIQQTLSSKDQDCAP